MQSVLKKACKLSSWYLQGFLVSFTEGTGSLIFIEIKMQKRDFLAAAEQRGGPPYTTPSSPAEACCLYTSSSISYSFGSSLGTDATEAGIISLF